MSGKYGKCDTCRTKFRRSDPNIISFTYEGALYRFCDKLCQDRYMVIFEVVEYDIEIEFR